MKVNALLIVTLAALAGCPEDGVADASSVGDAIGIVDAGSDTGSLPDGSLADRASGDSASTDSASTDSTSTDVVFADTAADHDASGSADAGPTETCVQDPRRERPPATGSIGVVDQADPDCDDQGAGSAETPWCTVQAAADSAAPGLQVAVRAGTYEEQVTITASGTSQAKIVFYSEEPLAAEVRGFEIRGDHVRVEGFLVRLHGTAFEDEGAIVAAGGQVEVVENEVREVHKVAITTSGDQNYVAANRLYQVQMGIVAHGNGWLVEDNEVERLYDYGGLGDADYTRFFGDQGTMRANLFHGTDRGETGDAHVDCFQTFDNNGRTATNMLFERNVCFVFSQGIMAEGRQLDGSHHWVVKNNVFAHGGAWGLDIHDIDDVTVLHNTFVDIGIFGVGIRSTAQRARVFNNLFYGVDSTSYFFEETTTGEGDNNLIFNSGAPSAVGPNDIIGEDPGLRDPSADDFHLTPGSPAENAGADLPEVSLDGDCTPRPSGGGWDIGADELP